MKLYLPQIANNNVTEMFFSNSKEKIRMFSKYMLRGGILIMELFYSELCYRILEYLLNSALNLLQNSVTVEKRNY